MSHRSLPPSHFAPPSIRPATLLSMIRRTPAVPAEASPSTSRVRVFPSPDGTVLLVGTTLTGKWVAEYRCLADDFDSRCITAMERRVLAKERKDGPQLVR